MHMHVCTCMHTCTYGLYGLYGRFWPCCEKSARYITVTLPLNYRYIAVTSPLHYHYILVTSPLHYRYITITCMYGLYAVCTANFGLTVRRVRVTLPLHCR